MFLPLAAQANEIGPVAAVMAFGLVIGVAGHIGRSRTLIVTGIVIIGLASAYFGFVVAKVR